MKKSRIVSNASLIASALVTTGAVAGGTGDDHLLISGKPSSDDDYFIPAPTTDTDTHVVSWDGNSDGLDEFSLPLTKAELHYTIFAGPGDDMVRVPDTELREVKSPRGRTFTIQVNVKTREVYTPTGEKLDPPKWLVDLLRQGG